MAASSKRNGDDRHYSILTNLSLLYNDLEISEMFHLLRKESTMCMCGDPYCWSCGPAQGNWKCEACGKWTHDGGCEDPMACAEIIRQHEEERRQWEHLEEAEFMEDNW
jgi:hypothetical protein